MMMKTLWLALAVVTPAASATYVVKKLYGATDSTCTGTTPVTSTYTVAMFAGFLYANAKAPAGNMCWPLDPSNKNVFHKMTASAGKCQMGQHDDKACATKPSKSMVFWDGKECSKSQEDGKVVHELITCGNAVVGKDFTCLNSYADVAKVMAAGTAPACIFGCSEIATTCDSMAKALSTGCAKTCTTEEIATLRLMMLINEKNEIDCKCAAGLPVTTEVSSSYHAIPQLAMLVIASISAAA